MENTLTVQGSNNPQHYTTSDNYDELHKYTQLVKCFEGLQKIKDDGDRVRCGEVLHPKAASFLWNLYSSLLNGTCPFSYYSLAKTGKTALVIKNGDMKKF